MLSVHPATMLSGLEGNVAYLMNTFTSRLNEAFIARGKTRAELAAELIGPDGKVGISVQAVGAQLSGKTKSMTAENLAKAAKFLNVNAHWLATGEGSPDADISPLAGQILADPLGRYLNLERDAGFPETNDQVLARETPRELVAPAAIGMAVSQIAQILLDLKGPRQAAAAALVRHLADHPRDYIEVMSELSRYVTEESRANAKQA